jgi:RNA polymerase sigma-70 factor, ECF subfamily
MKSIEVPVARLALLGLGNRGEKHKMPLVILQNQHHLYADQAGSHGLTDKMMGENDRGESQAQNWILKTAQGDADSFARLYDHYSTRLYSLAVQMVKSPEMAGEVLQDTFVDLWKTAHRYDPAKSSLFSWMVMILRRKAIDQMRFESNRIPGPIEAVDQEKETQVATNSPALEAAQREETNLIRQSLSALPAEQRDALSLAFFDGMTHEEVATHLNLPVGTIKSRIRLGLNKLRHQFGNYER